MISREFEASLPGGGGKLVAYCACGRMHFATGPLACDYEPGELDELRERAKTTPDQYLEDAGNDSIGVYLLEGTVVVWNCPCQYLKNLETFLIENQIWIIAFYRARAERLQKEAAAAAMQLTSLDIEFNSNFLKRKEAAATTRGQSTLEVDDG